MKRLSVLAFVIAALLFSLLKAAAAQLAEEARMATPEYWAQIDAEDRSLGHHANAHDVAYGDTDAGMWETGE